MAARSTIAIEIGRQRLRAISASRQRGRLRVKRVLDKEVPVELRSAEPEALGAWMGEQLSAAGFGQGKATVALSREYVGLKRFTLPTTDPNELPQMTRLALQREMPFDAEQAVIDYVPVEREGARTRVLAVAAPAEVLNNTRRMLEAADLGVDRISLRAMGTAAMLRSMVTPEGGILAVDITGESVEFCVLEDGVISFSRAAEIPHADEPQVVAEVVMTETRRTWMSYRIVEGASDVEHVVLLGNREVVAHAAVPVGEMLKAVPIIVETHPLIEANGVAMDAVWPLAGLLLEPDLAKEMIDFAKPRKAVDRASRLRQRVLLVASLVLVAILGGWLMANKQIRDLGHRLETLSGQQSALMSKWVEHRREELTVIHLRRWDTVRPQWLEHVRYLRDIMPPRQDAVLDSWDGRLDFGGVRYDKKNKKWSTPQALTIIIDGEARDRATADALRESLVKPAWSVTISSGADAQGGRRLPFSFMYSVRTPHGAPPASEEESRMTVAERQRSADVRERGATR